MKPISISAEALFEEHQPSLRWEWIAGHAHPERRFDEAAVRDAIPFDAPDDEAVSLLIFLLVPEAATQRHLEILSEIAELLSDRTLRDKLKTAPDAATVHQLIADWEPLKSVA